VGRRPGATNDLYRRLEQHAAGKGSRYTRSRLPVRLAYQEQVKNKGAALRREAALKHLTRAEKLALVAAARATRRERVREGRAGLCDKAAPQG